MKNSHLLITALICMALCYILSGCGGGTSGSGVVVVRGLVKTSTGDPLPNATVELLETGTTAVTDTDGMYSLSPGQQIPQISLNIKTAALNVNVPEVPVPPKQDAVTVNVVVNPASDTGEATVVDASDVQFFGIRASFQPGCDVYFQNVGKDIIRQSNRIKSGTACTLKVTVHGDGLLLSDIAVGLERISCDPKAPPVPIANTDTLQTPHQGVAQLSFNYYDNIDACEYRISVPFKDPLHRQVYVHIYTLTEQNLQ